MKTVYVLPMETTERFDISGLVTNDRQKPVDAHIVIGVTPGMIFGELSLNGQTMNLGNLCFDWTTRQFMTLVRIGCDAALNVKPKKSIRNRLAKFVRTHVLDSGTKITFDQDEIGTTVTFSKGNQTYGFRPQPEVA